MVRYYKISEAAYLLGVCKKTIRRWDANGLLECMRTLGGHRRISDREIERILNGEKSQINAQLRGKVAIYCRVSSHEQKKKGDLDRQVEYVKQYCLNNYKGHDFIFHDIGSGLNTHRSGLRKLCKLVEKRRVAKVVLTYHDRLTRFEFQKIMA
jgi:excisionase family DNA binding protein